MLFSVRFGTFVNIVKNCSFQLKYLKSFQILLSWFVLMLSFMSVALPNAVFEGAGGTHRSYGINS